jgi:hypothetical protein
MEKIAAPASAAQHFNPCFLTAETLEDCLGFVAVHKAADPRFAIFGAPADALTGDGAAYRHYIW